MSEGGNCSGQRKCKEAGVMAWVEVGWEALLRKQHLSKISEMRECARCISEDGGFQAEGKATAKSLRRVVGGEVPDIKGRGDLHRGTLHGRGSWSSNRQTRVSNTMRQKVLQHGGGSRHPT